MKNNDLLKDLHIGSIIKEIARQKGISSKQITNTIYKYQKNADKIFRLNDMDTEDVVRISYLLRYNILECIVQQYISTLPTVNKLKVSEFYILKLDMSNLRITIDETFYNCDFLKNIYIGERIRKVVEMNGYSLLDMAKKLHCTKSTICYLYKCKSLKLKTLFYISNALQFNFIAEVYLSQMIIDSSFNQLDDYTITINSQQIRIMNSNDKNLMVFQRNDDKK
jgi:transcriptional regulator with XRE-family HTH domain